MRFAFIVLGILGLANSVNAQELSRADFDFLQPHRFLSKRLEEDEQRVATKKSAMMTKYDAVLKKAVANNKVVICYVRTASYKIDNSYSLLIGEPFGIFDDLPEGVVVFVPYNGAMYFDTSKVLPASATVEDILAEATRMIMHYYPPPLPVQQSRPIQQMLSMPACRSCGH